MLQILLFKISSSSKDEGSYFCEEIDDKDWMPFYGEQCLQEGWTNFFHPFVNKLSPSCVVVFQRHHVFSAATFEKDARIFSAQAKCKVPGNTNKFVLYFNYNFFITLRLPFYFFPHPSLQIGENSRTKGANEALSISPSSRFWQALKLSGSFQNGKVSQYNFCLPTIYLIFF